jgi:hypothetical protein
MQTPRIHLAATISCQEEPLRYVMNWNPAQSSSCSMYRYLYEYVLGGRPGKFGPEASLLAYRLHDILGQCLTMREMC